MRCRRPEETSGTENVVYVLKKNTKMFKANKPEFLKGIYGTAAGAQFSTSFPELAGLQKG